MVHSCVQPLHVSITVSTAVPGRRQSTVMVLPSRVGRATPGSELTTVKLSCSDGCSPQMSISTVAFEIAASSLTERVNCFTGASTVTVTLSLTSPQAAVIVASPGRIAVMRPAITSTTSGAELLQVMGSSYSPNTTFTATSATSPTSMLSFAREMLNSRGLSASSGFR